MNERGGGTAAFLSPFRTTIFYKRQVQHTLFHRREDRLARTTSSELGSLNPTFTERPLDGEAADV